MLMIVSFEYLVKKEAIHYIDNYYFPLYVINYDCGYSSRLLVGSVLSLFFDGKLMSPTFILKLLLCVYAFNCILISLFLNNYLKKTKYEAIRIYSFFLIITPMMVAFLRYLGTLDIFWIVFVLGSLWLVDKKGWRWLVPIFCALSLCIYELFVTTYLPVMAIAVFYQFVKKPNVPNLIYITVCAIFVGAATIYFLIIGDSTIKMTSEQMVEFARSRLDAQGSSFADFYLRTVFFLEVPDDSNGVMEYVKNTNSLMEYIKNSFAIATANNTSSFKSTIYFYVSNVLYSFPYLYLMANTFKKAKKPLEKFVFLCCLSTLPLMFINLLLSTDTDRFSFHFMFSSLLTLLFFVKENSSTFSDSYDEIILKLREHKILFAIIAISFSRIILSGVNF